MDNQSQEKMKKKWAEIVAKAWTDEKFKKRLLQNPQEVLKEHGFNLPSGVTFKALENTKTMHYLILPEKPSGKISDEELKSIAAAGISLPLPELG